MTTRSLRTTGEVGRLAEIRDFIRSACAEVEASSDCQVDLVQAVDEAVTNVAVHGYRGRGGPIDLTVDRDGDRIVVTVADRAPAFDPTTVAPPDPAIPPGRRRPGGMGVHLIRAATDSMTHRRRPGGGNVLTLVRTLSVREPEEG